MAWQDDIAEKRREAQAQKASQSLHNESINAVTDNGRRVVEALQQTAGGTKSVTVENDNLADKQDIDKLLQQLKENQLATFLSAQKEPKTTTILSDSAIQVGEAVDRLGKKLMAKLEDSSANDLTTQSLTELKSTIASLNKLMSGTNTDFSKQMKELSDLLRNIEVNPVVNVQAPKVTVKPADVDLKPLQDTLTTYFAGKDDDGIDLECYRAQDIDNSSRDMQYIGFVNPDGAWYIIENNIKGDKLRYLFGVAGYAEAFAQASSYEYKLLDEAIHALQA